jgi:hypothetical protein
MHCQSFAAVCAAILIGVAVGMPADAAALKRVPYSEVKIELAKAFKGDPAFTAMRKAFADAVAKKDANALFALVGPVFLWTKGGLVADQCDLGRDALHNFKVVFNFREMGKDTDGGVEGGPSWDELATYATDETTYSQNDNLVCTPTVATLADDTIFDQARKKIDPNDGGVDWYFTLADSTPVAKAPADSGAPIGKVGKVALPVLGRHPPSPEDKPVTPTHYEVLMPNGRTGWIPASAARPLEGNQLCFAKTPQRDWKIVTLDEPQEQGPPDEQ